MKSNSNAKLKLDRTTLWQCGYIASGIMCVLFAFTITNFGIALSMIVSGTISALYTIRRLKEYNEE